MTGEGLVCRLKNLSKIENADNILKAEMFGETVIVSKDYIEGQLGILYDCETSLSFEYAKNNNLFRHSNLNLDTNKVGYLEDNCRIRPVRLRGCKCSALFMPIESLLYTGKKLPTEGMQINEWQGKEICKKYIRPIRRAGMHNKSKVKKVQEVFNFVEHIETDQLLRNLHDIKPGQKIIVTTKIHGTSSRVGLLPCLPRNPIKRLWYKLFNIKLPYKMVVGSRHVLKHVEGQKCDNKASFYDADIWTDSAYKYFHNKLIPGETIYYEIAGFLPTGTPIMPSSSNEKLKKFLEPEEYKEFIKKYGKETVFSYGCRHDYDYVDNGHAGLEKIYEYKIFVYRITLTTEHGASIDLTWEQVKRRCEELGVNHVQEILVDYNHGNIINDKGHSFSDEEYWLNLTEQDCKFFPQHLNEGIVVRLEGSSLQPKIYKNKRYAFKVLEGIIKDSAEFADLEESN